ncbi:MAG: malic enzyme-like NAD(P)-binding protein [bacterium]
MLKEKALHYHKFPKPGKIDIVPTKECLTQNDLSLAYTPGVAEPCREIEKTPSLAYDYTGKGNLVGVITDGTAVLGLGDIGPLAGKPVMEGKALLFKRFADINSYDIEVAETNPAEFIKIVKSLEPTFGGINLEDIASPKCFEIEEKLKEIMDIPVFHDDQHGTAVIGVAAILNGLEVAGKKPENCKVVLTGPGAAGVAIAKHMVNCGFKEENIFAYDSKGVLYKGRKETKSPYHAFLFRETEKRTLLELFEGADVFIGTSIKGMVTEEMIMKMAPNPVILPMANPDPEIPYEVIVKARPDAMAGTGRSDYPNQVNNVLGFPAIFRGALDVRARKITEKMKMAATFALMRVAKMDVLKSVLDVYGLKELSFGKDYLIPKPFDPRVLVEVAASVAEMAMEEGMSRIDIDIAKYKKELSEKFVKNE